jgi:hypothetical protein
VSTGASAEPVPADGLPVPLPRWTAPLFLVFSVGLVPWIVFLAVTLPRRYTVRHYDLAWVGFDIGVLSALIVLMVLAHRRSPRVELAAAAAGTLLIVDAWFDVTTSSGGDLWQAVASALVFELPIAGLCWWIAANADAVRRRRESSLVRLRRWRPDVTAPR